MPKPRVPNVPPRGPITGNTGPLKPPEMRMKPRRMAGFGSDEPVSMTSQRPKRVINWNRRARMAQEAPASMNPEPMAAEPEVSYPTKWPTAQPNTPGNILRAQKGLEDAVSNYSPEMPNQPPEMPGFGSEMMPQQLRQPLGRRRLIPNQEMPAPVFRGRRMPGMWF